MQFHLNINMCESQKNNSNYMGFTTAIAMAYTASGLLLLRRMQELTSLVKSFLYTLYFFMPFPTYFYDNRLYLHLYVQL